MSTAEKAGRGQQGTGVPWLVLGWAHPSAPPGEEGTEDVPIQNFSIFGTVPHLLQDTLLHGRNWSEAPG